MYYYHMLNYLYVILYLNNQALKYFTRTLGITAIGKISYFLVIYSS